MSEDVDREKVLQTTKVRTSIKSDLSWIQKTKKAAEQDSSTKESTVPAEEGTLPIRRQLSYVLMTAKKFESSTTPPLSPTQVTSLKQPDTENGLQNGKHSEPVSPEPTAASATTEEKNHAELPKSNDSAEVSTKVEEIIVNDTTSVEEPVACTVPDILADSAFKSPPPPENSNEVPKATALDILSESLVEPILNINPTSEIAADQNVLEILSDTLVEPILNVNSSSETATDQNTLDTLNLDKPVIAQTCDEPVEGTDLPQDSIASTETQSAPTNENIVVSETTVEVTIVQNNADPAKGEGSEEATEVPKEVSAISSAADVAQDNTETKEEIIESVSRSPEVNGPNDVNPVREEVAEVSKEPEIPAIETVVPQDNAEAQETHLTSTVAVSGRTEADIAQNDVEPLKTREEADISAISSDADVPQDNVENKETTLLSTQHVAGTESLEISSAQNNVNPVITIDQAAGSSEVPKEPEIPASVTDVPQENGEPNETHSTEEDVVEKENGEINVQNEVEPVKASKEVTEVPKEPEIPAKDNVDLTATPDIVESGITNAEEQKASDNTAIAPADTEVLSVSLPNGDTNINVDSTITQDNVVNQGITEEVLSETKEATVDQNSNVQESKITEFVDAEMPCPANSTTAELAQNNVTNELAQVEIVMPDNTSIVVDPEGTPQNDEEEKTPAKESPENLNTVETSVETPVGTIEIEETITNGSESESTANDVEEKTFIPEKEIVIDVIPAEESTVSGIIESEQKQTTEDPVVCTETLTEPPKENAEDLNKVEVQASLETPEIAENVETAAQSSPVLTEINQDEIFKAEPVVLVSSPEPASEVGESSPLKNITEETSVDTLTETTIKPEVESTPVIPSVASENQAALDISDALDVVINSEQSKEEGGEYEITDALDKATVDKTVNGFEEPEDSTEEKQSTDNISVPSLEEKEKNSSFIMRDGKEVCSHCDQFIGLIKLTVSYPPKYLHPECLMCGECTKILGDLLTPMFEHNQVIYCSACYDKIYSLS